MTSSNPAQLNQAVTLLRQKQMTVSFAESCTGGLLAASWTALAGISDVFNGGVVAYKNEVKVKVLGVHEEVLKEHGAVAEVTAILMAKGVRSVTDSGFGIGITGIAGPSGGSAQKPVGLVCFGLAGPGIEFSTQRVFSGHRNEIQEQACDFANQILLTALTSGDAGLQLLK